MSWSKQERPTWVNVLKLCGVDIDDRAGPAISNQLILNSLIESVMDQNYDHVVCQITATNKIDIELTNDVRRQAMDVDTIRNFSHDGYWPSSTSREHVSKKLYYDYIHSPSLEQSDIIYKWLLLNKICKEKGTRLHTIFGYGINWVNERHALINADHDYNIWDDYEQGEHYAAHDHSKGDKNTVPNKYFQIHLAKKINDEFLRLPISDKLDRFHD